MSAAFGLLLVGALNVISVAFFVLFIGLGVDFGCSSACATAPSVTSSAISGPRCNRRGQSRRAIGAGRGSDRGRVLLIPADHLPRRLRTRADRRLRNDHCLPDQHHLAAGVAHACSTRRPNRRRWVLLRWRRSTGSSNASASRSSAGLALVVLAVAAALLAAVSTSIRSTCATPSSESIATYLDLTRDPETNSQCGRDHGADAWRGEGDRRPAVEGAARRADMTLDELHPRRTRRRNCTLIHDGGRLVGASDPQNAEPPPSDADNIEALREGPMHSSRPPASKGPAPTRQGGSLRLLTTVAQGRPRAARQGRGGVRPAAGDRPGEPAGGAAARADDADNRCRPSSSETG